MVSIKRDQRGNIQKLEKTEDLCSWSETVTGHSLTCFKRRKDISIKVAVSQKK